MNKGDCAILASLGGDKWADDQNLFFFFSPFQLGSNSSRVFFFSSHMFLPALTGRVTVRAICHVLLLCCGAGDLVNAERGSLECFLTCAVQVSCGSTVIIKAIILR